MSTTIAPTPAQAALEKLAAALKRAADFSLPPALDRRILDLGERKDSLTPDERAELFAWVAFTQQRSLDQLEAEAALRRLESAYPDLNARQ